MALIKCPECGKEISDSAKSCPNCGYVKVAVYMGTYCPKCLQTGLRFSGDEKCNFCLTPEKDSIKGTIQEIDLYVLNHPELKNNPEFDEVEYNKRIKKQSKEYNVISCPYCNSTDTQKISNLSKAVHTSFFGIFSMSRNSKEWHCNSCKSDF